MRTSSKTRDIDRSGTEVIHNERVAPCDLGHRGRKICAKICRPPIGQRGVLSLECELVHTRTHHVMRHVWAVSRTRGYRICQRVMEWGAPIPVPSAAHG